MTLFLRKNANTWPKMYNNFCHYPELSTGVIYPPGLAFHNGESGN